MKICTCDTFDMAVDIMKATTRQLPYHPEAVLLSDVFNTAWKRSSSKLMKAIRASFNLSGEGSVDRKKQKDLKKLGAQTGKGMAKKVRPKTLVLFKVVNARATKRYSRLIKNPPKPVKENKFDKDKNLIKGATETAAWFAFMQEVSVDHVERFLEAFPERILLPEVEKLTKLMEINPNARSIDLIALKDRLKKFPNRPAIYFENLSDVYIGRQWRFTGLEMMWEGGVTSYQLISQGDKKTCPVCQRLHGKIFSVPAAKKKMDKFLQLDDPGVMAEHYKFPRVNNQAWRAWRANQ